MTSRGRAPRCLQYGLVGFVIIGYVLALSTSPVGHGWQLLTHLASQHHEVANAGAELGNPEADQPLAARRGLDDATHQHSGQTHTHESTSDGPDVPALLPIAIDKHCVFGTAALPPPHLHPHYGVSPEENWSRSALHVETPPPRRVG